MTDHPIIFSAPMIRALLDGRKTMTRRLARKYPKNMSFHNHALYPLTPWAKAKPGDRLWVREGWKPHSLYAHMKPRDIPQSHIFYLADDGYSPSNTGGKPSIHMPRWASRLTLTVTATKVERLQDITHEDAIAEGMADFATFLTGKEGPLPSEREAADECARRLRWPQRWFEGLWRDLHGPESWDANPEVVALSFTVQKANIDSLPRAA